MATFHRRKRPHRTVERSGHNRIGRTVLILLIAPVGLAFLAFFDDSDVVLPPGARNTSSGGRAETRAESPRSPSASVFHHTEFSTQQTRMKVAPKRSLEQTIVPERRMSTLESIQVTWIAGADAGAPGIFLDYLESMLRAHPVRSPEARLARRAHDDLLALRDRRLGRDRFDHHDERSGREALRRRNEERIAEYAHVLRHDDRADTIDKALGALGTVRQESAVAAVLGAGQLPEHAQRERRIRLLWRMAADDVSTEAGAMIRDQLERAVWSSDPGESALARNALADLDHFLFGASREEY